MVALLLAALFQSAAPAAAAAAPSAPPAKAARLCRTETVVGSTIKKRICRPKPAEEVAREDKTEPAQLAQSSPK
ncbi:MAG: hypothetical protein KKE02_12970 [Alphaproteobacteria bacterium]|nr:hypothetical protein [Alphaproteobacteria bacterium]MBU1512773.1 hypothetical protein [Alphaproteobacteria bacterium]MBU2096558.1 hypothetical protein [Alphaproteobacteria bacterium]MBU2151926.1 hypothetical protein [Alphaproteobacteria bacterium]MBU2306436.1 hypothetical protein [Alphaproteobacteria bacterium]